MYRYDKFFVFFPITNLINHSMEFWEFFNLHAMKGIQPSILWNFASEMEGDMKFSRLTLGKKSHISW